MKYMDLEVKLLVQEGRQAMIELERGEVQQEQQDYQGVIEKLVVATVKHGVKELIETQPESIIGRVEGGCEEELIRYNNRYGSDNRSTMRCRRRGSDSGGGVLFDKIEASSRPIKGHLWRSAVE